MKCPVCETVDLQMSERQGVEIDYCPKCRGVWLDRGELDKIIERGAQVETSYSVPVQGEKRKRGDGTYYDDDDYEYSDDRTKNPKRRRGGFLDDIFDIFD
jgi:Zn-finger nucleic acid-binding protein